MFESVTVDPGEDALRRAAKLFRVVAVLMALATALLSFLDFRLVRLIVNAVLVVIAWMTAGGIEEQRPWAKWTGYAFAVAELFSIPIGTIVGITTLVYLQRASKAGLFKPR